MVEVAKLESDLHSVGRALGDILAELGIRDRGHFSFPKTSHFSYHDRLTLPLNIAYLVSLILFVGSLLFRDLTASTMVRESWS